MDVKEINFPEKRIAKNIMWDVDYQEDIDTLPKEIEIPSNIEDDDEAISNYISNKTGFCHFGFILERINTTSYECHNKEINYEVFVLSEKLKDLGFELNQFLRSEGYTAGFAYEIREKIDNIASKLQGLSGYYLG